MTIPRSVCVLAAVACLLIATPASAASDPARAQQWALTQIKADQAWSVSSGKNVTIAIVDTGIDLTHADLKSKIVAHYDCTGGKCRTGGADDNGHGTHVAGIAAAATGNGIGIAGVAPAANLMAVKVLDSSGGGQCGDIALGMRWATDHGARVINLSLGPELPGILATLLQSGCINSLEKEAQYAWNKGVFIAIAAGNDRLKDAYSNAALEVVGATGPDDTPASYSSSGADVYAPGGDAPLSCSSKTCILSTWNDGGYALDQGTSMATPHVSGIAALLFARGYSNVQIRQRLSSTADKVGGILRVDATRAVGTKAAGSFASPSIAGSRSVSRSTYTANPAFSRGTSTHSSQPNETAQGAGPAQPAFAPAQASSDVNEPSSTWMIVVGIGLLLGAGAAATFMRRTRPTRANV